MDTATLITLPLETLQQRLNEALEALHRLHIGDREVLVSDSQGARTQYSETNIGALQAYVERLQAAIDAKRAGRHGRRGPIYLGVG